MRRGSTSGAKQSAARVPIRAPKRAVDQIDELNDEMSAWIGKRATDGTDLCMQAVMHVAEPLGGTSPQGVLLALRWITSALLKRGRLVVSLATQANPMAEALEFDACDFEMVAAGSGKGKSVLAANVGESVLNEVFNLVASVAPYHRKAYAMLAHHHPSELTGERMRVEGLIADPSIAALAKSLAANPLQTRSSAFVLEGSSWAKRITCTSGSPVEKPCTLLLWDGLLGKNDGVIKCAPGSPLDDLSAAALDQMLHLLPAPPSAHHVTRAVRQCRATRVPLQPAHLQPARGVAGAGCL